MSWPATAVEFKAELLLGGTWTDVTSDIRLEGGEVSVTQGIPDEATSADAGTCIFELNNADGKYSSRNPSSPYFGLLNYGTQIRCGIEGQGNTPYAWLTGADGDYWSTADTAALDLTGDLDVRWDGVAQWFVGDATLRPLATKYTATGNQRSWYLGCADGLLVFGWSADGTNVITATSTAAVKPARDTGRVAVRATLDVNNGAAGNTVTFYTAATAAGPWVQLGSAVVHAGTTSVYSSSAAVQLAQRDVPGGAVTRGRCYSFELRNGIGGSLVTNPVFSSQANGATSFTDAQGRTWAGHGGSIVTDRIPVFHGTISDFPTSWTPGAAYSWTSVTAQGPIRGLIHLGDPLPSVLRRKVDSYVSTLDIVGYWPCEDESGSTQIATALPASDGTAMLPVTAGASDFGADSSFACSRAIMKTGNGTYQAPVTQRTNRTALWIRFLLNAPSGTVDNSTILWTYMTGDVHHVGVIYRSAGGGSIRVVFYAASGSALLDTTWAAGITDKNVLIGVKLTLFGAGINYTISATTMDGTTTSTSGNVALAVMGRPTGVRTNPYGNCNVSLGHLWLQGTIGTGVDVQDSLDGYLGETAASRITRLCQEQGVTLDLDGDPADSEQAGAQTTDSLLAQLQSMAELDGGYLTEHAETLGFRYRRRVGLYTDLSDPWELTRLGDFLPVDSDQGIHNDITVTRTGGSSARAELTTGRLGTGQLGSRPDAPELPARLDSRLSDLAAWILARSTVDEARYPDVPLVLSGASWPATAARLNALCAGQLVSIPTPAGAGWTPDDAFALVRGWEWAIGVQWIGLRLATAPAAPYVIGIWDAPTSRWDSADSTVSGAHTAVTTSLAVAGDTKWTHADGDYDIIISGERMTVKAVAGSAPSQTFTVVRSVNGVVKAHASGEEIHLFQPVRWGL